IWCRQPQTVMDHQTVDISLITHIQHPRIDPFLVILNRHPPRPPLFPYTTLFRSLLALAPHGEARIGARPHRRDRPRELPIALDRSEEHTSELQSLAYLVCRLLLEKKKKLLQVHQ